MACASFAVYFTMFAFRKPFTAATYDGERFFSSAVALKSALVIAQVCGYGLAKYLGVKFCSELDRTRRFRTLLGMVLAAEGALLLLPLLPPSWGVLALFLNGVPLGMVWGLVVLYLEGRRSSEMLLAALSCSFILADGVVKDVGRALLDGTTIPLFGLPLPNPLGPLAQQWMPAATGALFLLPFAVGAWLLNQSPPPSAEDVAARSARTPMPRDARRAFTRRFLPGLVALLAVYFFVTALRDLRSNFNVELLKQLDLAEQKTVITRAESFVTVGVLAAMSSLLLVRDNRRALVAVFAVMAAGLLLVSAAGALHDAGRIDGFWWMTLVGLGVYLAYVPFGSVLFDRLLASVKARGTAVFGIYLADAAGYTGSVSLLLYKEFTGGAGMKVEFLKTYGHWLAVGGVTALAAACLYFLRSPTIEVADR